jgi:predicted nucleic acid-binding protein
MIVVDSSVWIGQFRGADRRAVSSLNHIMTMEEAYTIIVGDIVLVEVLRGARDDRHAEWIERRLRKFTIERMLDDRSAVRVAANYRKLRSFGVTVPTVDLIIATFCVERGHSLLHDDHDFDVMAAHLGLSVL